MAAPASGETLLGLVRKSALVEAKRIDAYVATASDIPDDPKAAARQLIRDGLVTHFQANQLLQGKWRGFTFGKYKVLERLGASANSNVYLCEHLVMHRRVAVKVLPTVRAEDPGALARFHREARAAAALDHPNIVHAFDSDQEGELHFIVMEYVDGFSLQEIVQKHGALSIPRAAHYIRQASTALEYIHERGLIHRDVKPGNLLLDRTGVIRILDLGLARFYHDHLDELTQQYDANNILGTADYLSPEQARDSHDVDTRTDIYSLGATLYFLLTARPPFEGKSVTQKLMAHQIKEPTPLRELRPDVPAELAAVVARMMAKDVAKRYRNSAEVAKALSVWTSQPIAAPPIETMPKLCPAAQLIGSSEAPRTVGNGSGSVLTGIRAELHAAIAEFDGAGSSDSGRSSSAISILHRGGHPGDPDLQSPHAETDNTLPRTDTQRDLPKPRRQRPVPSAPALPKSFALAAAIVAVLLVGVVIVTLLLK
jgi:serine/threonine protein kinase